MEAKLKMNRLLLILGLGMVLLMNSALGLTAKISQPQIPKEYDNVCDQDLTGLDFSNHQGLISKLVFNQKTIWPDKKRLPSGEEPDEIMKLGMNPGLGVRKLHAQGITGKGVNLAVIDQPLYNNHPEIKGKIVAYFNASGNVVGRMNGTAILSLLSGKNIGTAPGAKIYYAAVPTWTGDGAYYAKALRWIIEQNKLLAERDKIRVVSVLTSLSRNQWLWNTACKEAEQEGLLVLDNTPERKLFIPALYELNNQEAVGRCVPCNLSESGYLLVPAAARTVAIEKTQGVFDYQYNGGGFISWSLPYAVGVLALGCEVAPKVNGEDMAAMLFMSAYEDFNHQKYIDPVEFINLVKAYKAGKIDLNQSKKYQRKPTKDYFSLRLEALLGASKEELLGFLGEPKKYLWENKAYKSDQLPSMYLAVYRDDFHVLVSNGKVVELRFISPKYQLRGKLRCGSGLKEVLELLGKPKEVVIGQKCDYRNGVLYQDIDGKKGYCYYAQASQKIRVFCLNNQVSAMYFFID